jgi:hypothetical protein
MSRQSSTGAEVVVAQVIERFDTGCRRDGAGEFFDRHGLVTTIWLRQGVTKDVIEAQVRLDVGSACCAGCTRASQGLCRATRS